MKTALITGASTGIGKALAYEHAKNGEHVVLVARGEDRLNKLAEDLTEKYDVKAEVIAMDLTGENAAKELFDEIATRGLKLDYLINNAGIGDVSVFSEGELWRYQRIIQLNIIALTDLCHLFISHIKSNAKTGRILNVASTAAFHGLPNAAIYAATKAFVLSLSESLAVELSKEGITVTALCPGPTKTDFMNAADMNDRVNTLPVYASPESVAKFGYRKMQAGQVVAIHGALNKLGANSPRLMKREHVAKIAGSLMSLAKK